jgi:hypothetical protein
MAKSKSSKYRNAISIEQMFHKRLDWQIEGRRILKRLVKTAKPKLTEQDFRNLNSILPN